MIFKKSAHEGKKEKKPEMFVLAVFLLTFIQKSLSQSVQESKTLHFTAASRFMICYSRQILKWPYFSCESRPPTLIGYSYIVNIIDLIISFHIICEKTHELVGGFNPSEKYARQIGSSLSRIGVEIKNR